MKVSLSIVASLALASLSLTACSAVDPSSDRIGSAVSADVGENGLSWNGLANNGLANNGLANNGLANNGLANNGLANNGLANNGLTSASLTSLDGLQNLLDTNPYTSMFLSYVVSCALPAGQTIVVPSAANPGQSYTFTGELGVAPGWGLSDGASCDETCQRWVSACVISRVNYLGVHVEISIRGDNAALALADGEAAGFPDREATYFGNLFASPMEIHGCRTATDDQTLVDRPCGHGADVSGCIIDVIGDCGSVCSTFDPTIGYYGTCTTTGGTTYVPAVTIYRQP